MWRKAESFVFLAAGDPDVWDGFLLVSSAKEAVLHGMDLIHSGLFTCSKGQKISPRSKYLKSVFFPYIDSSFNPRQKPPGALFFQS